MKTKDIKIMVATHKKYTMPKDKIYFPVQVGSEGKNDLGYQKDNIGDNISNKNMCYCELTGMYWAWKNLKCDVIGLTHYRRYFTLNKCKSRDFNDKILNNTEIINLMNENDIIVGKKKFFPRNIWYTYKREHFISDLEITKGVIKERHPEYIEAFEKVMKGHKISICNMFIMSKELFDEYCTWLFDILFEVEKLTDISHYSNYQRRLYGFLSERLLNVWLEHNSQYKITHLDIFSLEHDKFDILLKKGIKRLLHIKK